MVAQVSQTMSQTTLTETSSIQRTVEFSKEMHCITKKCSTPNELTSVLVIKSYEEYCIVYVNIIVL